MFTDFLTIDLYFWPPFHVRWTVPQVRDFNRGVFEDHPPFGPRLDILRRSRACYVSRGRSCWTIPRIGHLFRMSRVCTRWVLFRNFSLSELPFVPSDLSKALLCHSFSVGLASFSAPFTSSDGSRLHSICCLYSFFLRSHLFRLNLALLL